MFPANFIDTKRIGCQVEAKSKKRVLEQLGHLLAQTLPGLTQDLIFDRLLERERLGSTGLGQGIALPHARMKELPQAYGAFIQLRKGVEFDAFDNHPVDLAFALLVPESATEEHLQLLAALASMFSNPQVCAELRESATPDEVLQKILDWEASPQTA
jgi:PTS system nitrogen regulatory IIA component